MGDDIPHRRPPGIGHRAFVEDLIPVAHRHRLEAFGRIERGGEPAADLGDDARQIPGGNAGEAVDGFPFFAHAASSPLGTLRKAPLVVLEKAPGPVGEDRLEDRFDFVGCSSNRRLKADQPLGVFGRPVAGVGMDSGGDGAGGVVPGPRGDRRQFEAFEGFEGRLRLPLVKRLLDIAPRGIPEPWGGGRLGRVAGDNPHHDCAEQEEAGERRDDTWGAGHGGKLRREERCGGGAGNGACGAKRQKL